MIFGISGGDDGARTRDLCRDSTEAGSNLLKLRVTDGFFWRSDVDGVNPRESVDGKTIYFASRSEKSTLKQLPVGSQPGTELVVKGLPSLNNATLWALAPGGIYFVSAEQPTRSVLYFDFASKQIRTVFESDHDFGTSLSVSPDGRWLICAQSGDVSSDIMLVDHFQ